MTDVGLSGGRRCCDWFAGAGFTYPWIAIPVLLGLLLLIGLALWWIGRKVWRFLFGRKDELPAAARRPE